MGAPETWGLPAQAAQRARFVVFLLKSKGSADKATLHDRRQAYDQAKALLGLLRRDLLANGYTPEQLETLP